METKGRDGAAERTRPTFLWSDLAGELGDNGGNMRHGSLLLWGWTHGSAPDDSHRSPHNGAAMVIARIGI